MDPYITLGLERSADDEEVAARYHELVIRYPPDKEPERFVSIRQAFEAIRTVRDRVELQLFRFDDTGGGLTEMLDHMDDRVKARISRQQLAELLEQDGE